jgi:predicted transcriptional regulator
MNLRQVIDALGLSQIALAREANISRFKLYEVLNGDTKLTLAEERSLLGVLSQYAAKAEQAIQMLRQIGQA